MRNQRDCAFVYTICLAGFLAGAGGCGDKPTPAEEPSAASSTVLTAAPPSPMVSDEIAVKTPYRIRVVYSGKSTVEFSVFVNGTQIGSYNSSSESDITPSLVPGKNAVKVAWTADSNMKSYDSARLYIETNQEDKWNTVLSREVRKETAAGETTLDLETNGPGAAPAGTPEVSSEPSATAAVMSPEVSPSSVTSSSPAVSTRYSIKVDVHEYSPASFSLALNGTTIGDFTSDANQDITQDVRPGKNVLSITWKHAGPVTNKFSQSKVVLGAERNGTWSTVANQGVGIDTKDGSRSITFVAK